MNSPAPVHSAPAPWRIWSVATRPRTLPLAAAPVLAGTALAWAEGAALQWWPVLAALLAALLIQIGTNLHNDAADYERGNDQSDRLGPLRVTAAGWASAGKVRLAAILVFGAALLLGVYLVIIGGVFILAIGCASLLAAWSYSGGLRPVSHSPFGELFVWVFFGLLAVAGSYWLQAGHASFTAWLTGAALGMPAAAVLLINNLRDRETDLRAGRRTLAALLGDHKARRAYVLMMLLPYAVLPSLASSGRHGVWLTLALLPFIVLLARRLLAGEQGQALNQHLAQTALAALAFALLLALGVLF
ncbi:MAG: 1,4-dihydroxy-2-naphthoate polyprenyltransferase [Thiohalomonadaceae bacterium]